MLGFLYIKNHFDPYKTYWVYSFPSLSQSLCSGPQEGRGLKSPRYLGVRCSMHDVACRFGLNHFQDWRVQQLVIVDNLCFLGVDVCHLVLNFDTWCS